MNVENKCIAFLKEYRAHPERYLPLTDKQYKHYNEWEEEIIRNMCWGTGLLEGNLPYFMECWKVFGMTTLTVTVFAEGQDPAEIVGMMQRSGLVQCSNPEKAKIHIKKVTEKNGKVFYGINSVMGKEDDDYAEQYLYWLGDSCRFDELNALNSARKN